MTTLREKMVCMRWATVSPWESTVVNTAMLGPTFCWSTTSPSIQRWTAPPIFAVQWLTFHFQKVTQWTTMTRIFTLVGWIEVKAMLELICGNKIELEMQLSLFFSAVDFRAKICIVVRLQRWNGRKNVTSRQFWDFRGVNFKICSFPWHKSICNYFLIPRIRWSQIGERNLFWTEEVEDG